ncbi:hypothetical protein JOQ06_003924, partial [Pogonophryne albipinna]
GGQRLRGVQRGWEGVTVEGAERQKRYLVGEGSQLRPLLCVLENNHVIRGLVERVIPPVFYLLLLSSIPLFFLPYADVFFTAFETPMTQRRLIRSPPS